MLAARAHLRVVGAAPEAPAARQEHTGTESALLDAWREAHWSLRLRMREVARGAGTQDLEALYDAARRADNRLTEFYQARADVLTRRLRDVLITAVPEGASPSSRAREMAGAPVLVDRSEQDLLRHFRSLGEDDRASLLRLASRLTSVGKDD